MWVMGCVQQIMTLKHTVDKIGGQASNSGRIFEPFFIGKTGS